MEGLNWLDKQEIPIMLDSEVVACCLDIEERVLPKTIAEKLARMMMAIMLVFDAQRSMQNWCVESGFSQKETPCTLGWQNHLSSPMNGGPNTGS